MTETITLSKDYYDHVFIPVLREKAPEAESFMAAGLVGEGSECFGFDDELSRDHDFGPGFCIWLPEKDYLRLSGLLDEIVLQLPDSYAGMKTFMEKPRRGVLKLEDFCAGLTGCDLRFLLEKTEGYNLHERNKRWLSMSEPGLAALTNGVLFADREGSFTKLRMILKNGYPEDIRLYKIAQNLISAAQISQYNYPRTFERQDRPALTIMKGRLTEYCCSLIFLLNHRFKPYYKWSSRAIKELPVLGNVMYEKLSLMCVSEEGEPIYEVMSEINNLILDVLRSERLSENDSPFLTDHIRDLLSGIRDKKLIQEPIPLL